MELVTKDPTPVVLFATPVHGGWVSMDYAACMFATQAEMARRRIPCAVRMIAGRYWTDIARNELVDYFLKSDLGFTDLFFIDADEGWDEKVIPRFLRYRQDVVAGLPPKKCDEEQYHSNAITGVIEDGLFQALEAGTGFMRIRRSVFERMDKAFDFKPLMEGEAGWPHTPYFQSGNTPYGRIGEDIFFCRQMCAMGEFVWIDSDVNFVHRGDKAWQGNFYEHAVKTGMLVKAG
jgi:hypothetical protein